jgi:hypothetical protein
LTATRFGAAIALLLLLALPACSKKTKAPTGPWASQIAASKRQASSEFERRVFADNTITRAEYEEAVHRYITCLNGRRVQMSADQQSDGTYQYSAPGPADSARDAAMAACSHGTTELISPLYTGILQNPKHVDPYVAMAACIVKKGKAPAGFTGAQLKDLLGRYNSMNDIPATAPINGKDQTVVACLRPPFG